MRADATGPEVFYAELYVGLPGQTGLKRCFLELTGSKRRPKLAVMGPGIPGVLWVCDL
ncbi:hypothetical protein ACFW2V_13660 [Streptomyces sp. NPDC058947]|uniref:hypothetical protein n=1 Tax=Streptomyces sp. NPDC058947 TaxID=3346675 RepID=UPI00367F73FD